VGQPSTNHKYDGIGNEEEYDDERVWTETARDEECI